MFILKNIHSGFNKINWSRTISRSSVVVQNEEPIYINPVNKKRQINFDEELLVIFFSILSYISEKYGFTISTNCNYELIKGKQFEHYLKGFGIVRLRQNKYKYFSDKALQLWELCFAFFEQSHQVKVNSQLNEYLLVKNFNIVFEAIIDELVGDKQLPDRLNKKQEDGKIVDHLFMWDSLTTADASKKVYYIGDSKYYKIGNEVGKESVAKQYTYARNVIQWNLNLFLDGEEKPERYDYKLRDELTEGYNIIPNFFISAKMDEKLSYVDTIDRTDRKKNQHFQRHFNNRLFDRDTLLITHYDVNFLFVVSLYARNNASQKLTWKTKVRNLFRKEIQQILADKYEFYAMTAKADIDGQQFLSENFKDVIGKVYTPFADKQVYSLALDKDKQFAQENQKVYSLLDSHFHIVKCDIGQDPTYLLTKKIEKEGDTHQSITSINKDERCVLTGYIPKSDSQYDSFNEGKGKRFDMKYIPSINLMAVKYFMPMVDGFVDGYYEVKSMSFKTIKEESTQGQIKETVALHLSLGNFIKIGDEKVFFYKVKMTAGQLHSIAKIEEDYAL